MIGEIISATVVFGGCNESETSLWLRNMWTFFLCIGLNGKMSEAVLFHQRSAKMGKAEDGRKQDKTTLAAKFPSICGTHCPSDAHPRSVLAPA